MRIAVLGASPKPERYSNRAVRLLKSKGYEVIPVNPVHKQIEGLAARAALADLEAGSIDTVTMYVGPERSATLLEDLKALQPRRVIFNPGAENPQLAAALAEAGVEVVEGCTLVMLQTGAFGES